MSFWKRFTRQIPEIVTEQKTVEINYEELKEQVNNSLKKVNDLGDSDYAMPLMDAITKIKIALKALASKEINNDNNQALTISANNDRKKIIEQLMPLLSIKKPQTLVSVNELLKTIEQVLNNTELINSQSHAELIFREEINSLKIALDELGNEVDSLSEAVKERNEQLVSFNTLVKEMKALNDMINKINKIKDDELDFRKKLSSYERDKTFMASEIARIKEIESFNDLRSVESMSKEVAHKKAEVEGAAMTIVSKFSRLLRKAFKNDEFVTGFLTNPLSYICKNEGEFNKRMSELINNLNKDKLDVNEKDKKRYLKALSDDSINEYINEYKTLLAKEEAFRGKDLTLLRKAEAFERRLIELTQKINSDVKNIDSYKDAVNDENKELDAIKAKVESIATECYGDKVRILI
ncbi:MAG TPA: hypothetical protein VI790_03470 [Candidatus Nanoarchaeia archaeon]|nr:hypothetical protein [Candidatus Nanoarchaeia archaeon]